MDYLVKGYGLLENILRTGTHRTGKMEAKQNYNTAYQSVHITHGHHLAFISQR